MGVFFEDRKSTNIQNVINFSDLSKSDQTSQA